MKHKISKRILSTLLAMVMLVGLLPIGAITVSAATESDGESIEVSDGDVIEVSSWSEFEEAFALSDYSGKSYTVKLMNDLHYDAADALRSATVLVEVDVNGCFVTLDFNGHTLSCTDDVSSTDLDSVLSDFIRINLHPIDHRNPIEFVLTDSVGGGGVSMDSYRAYDNQLAALHVVDTCNYISNLGYLQSTDWSCKLTINGGNYILNAATEKFGNGTLDWNTWYRGTVISDMLYDTEINGGTFIANGEGFFSDYVNADMCARELSAFATCSNKNKNASGRMSGRTVINGGTFISNGYSIHHFDHSFYELGGTQWMLFPTINGGVFSGRVGFIGMTFTYSDGYEEYENKKASEIINNDAYVVCIKDGNIYGLEDDLDLKDLHDATSLYVLSDSLFEFSTLPDVGEITDIERYTEQSDTYQVQYKVPYGFTSNQITPYIAVTPTGGTTTTYQTAEKIINYSDYPSGLTVNAGIAVTISGEVLYFENTYNVAVSNLPSPPEILAQPYSMTVAPGECAEAMVVANHAVSYQWYCLINGSPYKLTESIVSALGGGIAGYMSPRLSVTTDGVTKETFYCVVTGTDGSTVKTDRINFTFGEKPSEKSFGGGEYLANGNAEFKLFAKYAETVTWHVAHPQSGSTQIYTLEEFKELTGCEYKTSHKGYLNGLYCATVVFENVDESFSGKYMVGYTMENSLGSVTILDSADMVEFTLVEPRPVIQTFIETQTCYEGESMIFTFTADAMDYAEWIFEKPDEEGVEVAYDIEEMEQMFPDVTFEESLSDNVATLTISNAQTGLSEYMLYAYGGLAALSCAGSAEMRVIPFEGAVVSGTVTSFNSDTDDITIELFAEGSTSADYTDTVKGNTAEYFIVGVAEGTYTMRVTKASHVIVEEVITVSEDMTKDIELNLYADTNFDGEIDENDYQALVNAVLQDDHEQIGTAEYDDLIHYDLVMDGYLDALDAAVMALVVNGLKTIDEVYDIKKGDYDLDGEAYTESDLIAMYHVLSDIDSSAPTLSTSQKFASDLNYNGKVDEEDLNKLVRIYGEIEETTCEENVKVYYRWGNSYSTCTATAMCTLCGKKVATETVNSVQNADGSYTATFTNTLLGTKTYSSK